MQRKSEPKPWRADISHDSSNAKADAFGFSVSEVELASGSTVQFNRAGVTAIVGGNNVGKSTALREIHAAISLHAGQIQASEHILKSVSFDWEGTTADFLEWTGSTSPFVNQAHGQQGFVATSGEVLSPNLAIHYRNQAQEGEPFGGLAAFISYFATAKQRFDYIEPAARRDDINDPPSHPLHRLEENTDLLNEFVTAARDIFAVELTLDRVSGKLFFRVGKTSIGAPPIDNISNEYLDQLQHLPGLHVQGDGMQSALSLLLPVIAATYPLILVDEPEAFLHPPQARKLGSILARLAHSRGLQLIVATHDRHFLTGLLDADEVAVSVIRLSRDKDTSSAKHLDSSTLRRAWRTASLRHSNLLDGLFHKLVVIAENERDCRFYAAALEALDLQEELPLRPHDVIFVPSAGKGNISSLAEVLLVSGVPVVASPDLDILNNEASIKKMVEVFGGSWTDVNRIYAAATAEFRTPRVSRTNGQILLMIKAILESEPGDPYTSQTKRDVATALSITTEWQRLKEYGITAFRAQHGKAMELLDILAKLGIVPVRVGELENFAPEVNLRKGDAWLEEALTSNAHQAPAVQSHLRRILEAGGYAQGVNTI